MTLKSIHLCLEKSIDFFCAFIDYGSTNLHKKHVENPASETEASAFEKVFALAGFNGCIGSIDGAHAGFLSCPSWASVNHRGQKLATPSRNCNAAVTHSHQIIGTTCGHPGSWNEKTMTLFDDLIRGVNERRHYSNNEFKLFEMNKDKKLVELTCKGAWFIVDNGYLNWSCTVLPMKNPMSYEEISFSEWLESMRKDVECTFGSLKKIFAMLKCGLRSGSIEQCDELWLTCCALHNLILFNDGSCKGWETGRKRCPLEKSDEEHEIDYDSDYDEDEHEDEDEENIEFALRRLSRLKSTQEPCNYAENDVKHFDKHTL